METTKSTPEEICDECGQRWEYACDLPRCSNSDQGPATCVMQNKSTRAFSICPHFKKLSPGRGPRTLGLRTEAIDDLTLLAWGYTYKRFPGTLRFIPDKKMPLPLGDENEVSLI